MLVNLCRSAPFTFLILALGFEMNAQTITSGGLLFQKMQVNLPTAPSAVVVMKGYSGGAVMSLEDVASQKNTLYNMDVTGNATPMVGDGDPRINGDLIEDWCPTATTTFFSTTTSTIKNTTNGPSYSANWKYDKGSGTITRLYGYSDTLTISTSAGKVTGKPWFSTIVRNACPGNVDGALIGLAAANASAASSQQLIYRGLVNVDTYQEITAIKGPIVGNANGAEVLFIYGFSTDNAGFNFGTYDTVFPAGTFPPSKLVRVTWGGAQSVLFGQGAALDGETVTSGFTFSGALTLDARTGNFLVAYDVANGMRVAYFNGDQVSIIERSSDFAAQPNGFVTVASYGTPYFLGKSVYLGNAVFSLTGNGQMFLFNNGDKMPDGVSAAIMDGFTLPGGNGAIVYGRDGTGTNFWWWKVVVASTITTLAPTIQLAASATDIIPGQTTTLSWTVANADTVTLSPGVGSVTSTTGSQQVSPATTTTYMLTATGAGGTATASVTVTVHNEPYITAMTDLMGKSKGSFAQTEFVTLYGNQLCGQTVTGTAPFGNRLGNCQIQLSDGSLAVIQYSSPGQLNLMLPNVSVGAATIKVIDWTPGGATQEFAVNISAVSPTLVTNSSGVAAIYDNTSGQVVYGGPVNHGDAITFFLTGMGLTDSKLALGTAGVGNVIAPVLAFLNNQPITVIGAVSSPDFPGLYQVAVQLPATGANGSLTIQVGSSKVTSTITIN